MILPTSVTEYADRCSAFPSGTARNNTGTTTTTTSAKTASASHPRMSNSVWRWASMKPGRSALFISRLHCSAAQRKQPLWTLLNERDDQHEDQNLGGHGADVRLHEFADH